MSESLKYIGILVGCFKTAEKIKPVFEVGLGYVPNVRTESTSFTKLGNYNFFITSRAFQYQCSCQS